MTKTKTYIFRMVHWQNVEYILENGMCCRGHKLEDPDYINIGMRKLIEDRKDYPVPIKGAGNLGEYVPFYFAGHSPMLYTIINGYSGVAKRPQEDIIYFVSSVEKIEEEGLPFVFSDRHAKRAVANFYSSKSDLENLDWETIKKRKWANDQNNLSRRDIKQAEFLVHKHVPITCIHALVVKTLERKEYFEEIIRKLELEIEVHIDEKCKLYY